MFGGIFTGIGYPKLGCILCPAVLCVTLLYMGSEVWSFLWTHTIATSTANEDTLLLLEY